MEKKEIHPRRSRQGDQPAGAHDRKHGGTQGWACAEFEAEHLGIWFHRPHPSLACRGPLFPPHCSHHFLQEALLEPSAGFQAPNPCQTLLPKTVGGWRPPHPAVSQLLVNPANSNQLEPIMGPSALQPHCPGQDSQQQNLTLHIQALNTDCLTLGSCPVTSCAPKSQPFSNLPEDKTTI